MREILIACTSRRTAERGLRVAADLSVACGARLTLVYACGEEITPAAGLDAIGQLSSVLFTSGAHRSASRGQVPTFGASEAPAWLLSLQDRVGECLELHRSELTSGIATRRPDLVITCDRNLARSLVESTTTPIWRIRPNQPERSWFTARKVRCAVLGSRAAEWAGSFAAGLGAELETMQTGPLGGQTADLVVVAREERVPLLGGWAQPLVVV